MFMFLCKNEFISIFCITTKIFMNFRGNLDIILLFKRSVTFHELLFMWFNRQKEWKRAGVSNKEPKFNSISNEEWNFFLGPTKESVTFRPIENNLYKMQ
jgi:hypothetical protein